MAKKKPKRKKHPSRSKAKEMLAHGKVRGKPLTAKQRKYFGAVASGRARKR